MAPPITAVKSCGQLNKLVSVAATCGFISITDVNIEIAAYKNPNFSTAPVATPATLLFFLSRKKQATIIRFPMMIKGEKAKINGAIAALFVNADTSGAITDIAAPLQNPADAVAIISTALTIGPTTKLLYGINFPKS